MLTDRPVMENARAEIAPQSDRRPRLFAWYGLVLFAIHLAFMLYRYGDLPAAPVIGDEVIINDAAVALSHGQGFVAPSFQNSAFGLDRLYSHFPPLFLVAQAACFRLFGVSARSLRLTTTAMDLLAMATFLLLLWCLCRWRVAGWGTAAAAAPLYVLNAAVIVLHRIGRMESMVEFFVLSGLLCVLRAIFSPGLRGGSEPAERRRRMLWLALGAALTGMAMATHPEALTAVLPTVALIAVLAPVGWLLRLGMLLTVGLVPALIWIASYGARSLEALTNMGRILTDNTPPAGIFGFAQGFLQLDHRNSGQAMRATLFFLCLFVLEILLVRWALFESLALNRRSRLTGEGATQLRIAEIYAGCSAVTVVMLAFFVSASITRYQVIFPAYLAGMVMTLRGVPASRRLVAAVSVFLSVITLAEILAVGSYLRKWNNNEVGADRFDRVAEQIPPNLRVAVTPKLWLAFAHKNRPVTLLYKGFDGLPTWKENGANPLDRFDALVIDASFQSEFETYSQYAMHGRTKQVFRVGGDEVDLYLPAKQGPQFGVPEAR